jgi:hypothetical protein
MEERKEDGREGRRRRRRRVIGAERRLGEGRSRR